jgi:putative peptidoglycan lipid II flippase
MHTSLKLGFLATINVLLTFLYQWYILNAVGPGSISDAFFASMALPQMLMAIVAGSMTQVLVPILTNEKTEDFKREAWNFLQVIGSIFLFLSLILFATASFWIPWVVPGFDLQTQLLTVTLVRVQLLGMFFMSLNGVLWSAFYSRGQFIWAEMSGLLGTLGGLFLLAWGLPRFGIIIAAWAMAAKSFLQTILLFPGLGRYHKPNWQSGALKKSWQRLYPLLLGSSVYKTEILVDRFLSSMTSAGQLSLLYFASQIYQAGNFVLAKALSVPMVPELAKMAFAGKWETFRRILNSKLYWTLLITGAVIIGIISLGRPVLTFLFEHGRFTLVEIDTLYWILLALGGVWIGGALGQILSSAFYSKGNTRTPTKIGVIGFSMGLIMKIGGFWVGGILGIAIGTSIYYLLNVFLLKFFLNRNLGRRTSQTMDKV